MEKPFDRTLRYLWKHELSKLNDHLPARRIPFPDMLKNPNPSFPLRDGTHSAISRDELLDLANLVPSDLHNRLSLPFLFLRRVDLGRGTYKLLGSRFEKFCAERVLGLEEACSTPWPLFMKCQPRQYFYTHHVVQFRKRFRTISVIAITTTSNDSFMTQKDEGVLRVLDSNRRPERSEFFE